MWRHPLLAPAQGWEVAFNDSPVNSSNQRQVPSACSSRSRREAGLGACRVAPRSGYLTGHKAGVAADGGSARHASIMAERGDHHGRALTPRDHLGAPGPRLAFGGAPPGLVTKVLLLVETRR